MVSVIIVNYNTKDLVCDCVRSVIAKTKDVNYEIVVVDNASLDGSAVKLRQEFPEIKLIENTTNGGFAQANNLAIRESDADYLFVLNPDTTLINNAMKIFVEFMERPENRDVACCGGALYNERMEPQESYGIFPTLEKIVFKVFRLKKIFRKYYRERLKNVSENCGAVQKTVDYIVGADMFIRRSVFNTVGLFDEDFFLYFEETELCWRMFQNGYRSVILPDAKIIHLAGKSFSDAAETKRIRAREISRFLFFRKCYGERVARMVKILYLFQYAQRFLLGFNKKHKELFKIIWKA